MPGRVRGGVVSRTGDRVGDALEIRTRRVGVDGFVVRGGERSILLSFPPCRLPASFFCLGLPSGLYFFEQPRRLPVVR